MVLDLHGEIGVDYWQTIQNRPHTIVSPSPYWQAWWQVLYILFRLNKKETPWTVIRYVSINAKFGICTVAGLMGHMSKLKNALLTLEFCIN